MSMVQTGRPAPEFRLQDQHGKLATLRDFRGETVVLSFHPLAWTKVCSEQMQALEANATAFAGANAVALGVNVDPVPSKKAWAEHLKITQTRLLSDFWPHGLVAERYGIFRKDDGFSERAVFLLDGDGIVRFAKVYPMEKLPDLREILTAVRGLEDD